MFSDFANSHNIQVGLLAETTPGTLETGTFLRAAVTSVSPTPQSAQDTHIDQGRAAPSSVRGTSEHLSGTIQAPLRWADLDLLFALGLRDAVFPSEVTIVDTLDIVTAGTHLDGSTGAQLVALADATAFDALDAATSGDPDMMLIRISGATNADNNQPRRIKAKHVAGADSKLDIYPGYVGGGASAEYGAAMIAEVGSALTLKCGSGLREQLADPTTLRSYSALFHLADIGKWFYCAGLVLGPPSFAMTSRGMVNVTWQFLAQEMAALGDSAPSASTIDSTGVSWSEPMVGGADLEHLAAVTATTPSYMKGKSVTAFNLNIEGNMQAMIAALGSTGLDGVLRGAHVPTGNYTVQITDAALANALSALGHSATREDVILDAVWSDTSSRRIGLGILKTTHQGSAPAIPGGSNPVDLQMNWGSAYFSDAAGALLLQKWST